MVNINIGIGDKVYVGGIFGDDFKIINNKTGTVKRIMFSSNENYNTYLIDVDINGDIFPLNLSYVFKVDDFDTYDYDELLSEYPLEYYLETFQIIGTPTLMYDQLGLNYLYCKTKEFKVKPLMITSIN